MAYNPGNERKRKARNERKRKAQRLYREGWTVPHIAARLGVRLPTAYKYVNERYWLQPSRVENRERARTLHGQGLPPWRIGKALGVTQRTAREYLRELGIIQSANATFSKGRAERMAEAHRLHEAGFGLRRIAARLGVHKHTVSNYLYDVRGAPKRPRLLVQRKPERKPEPKRQAPDAQSVRALYEGGSSLRQVAARLGITLDEARAGLRRATPDTHERPLLSPEVRRGMSESALAAWAQQKAAV